MTTTPSQADEQETLPMDFLEFLAEGVVIEDEYLDPLNYEDIDQDITAAKESGLNELDQATDNKTNEVKRNEK